MSLYMCTVYCVILYFLFQYIHISCYYYYHYYCIEFPSWSWTVYGRRSKCLYNRLLLLFATLHYCTRISCLHYTLCTFLMLTFCLYSACTYKGTVILGIHTLIVCVCVNLVPLFAHDNTDHDACLRLQRGRLDFVLYYAVFSCLTIHS